MRGFRFGGFGIGRGTCRRPNEKIGWRLGAKFLARARKDGPAQLAMNSRSALIPDQQSDEDISFPDRLSNVKHPSIADRQLDTIHQYYRPTVR